MLRTSALLTTLLIVTLALATGCEVVGIGQSTPSGTPTPIGGVPTFDPARGDELAHAILPEAQSIPGGGWVVTETDRFWPSYDSDPTPEACKALEAASDEFAAAIEPIVSGKAMNGYQQATGSP